MATEAPDIEMKMDMTPMIDMVFQLVMFFIISVDFSRQELAFLKLPHSTAGIEDKAEDPRRIVINVTAPAPTEAELKNPDIARLWPQSRIDQANRILIRNKSYTFDQLLEYLKVRGVQYRPDPKDPTVAETSILIRCDGGQAFDLVKRIMQVCVHPNVRISKVEIATAEKTNGR